MSLREIQQPIKERYRDEPLEALAPSPPAHS
jgi:hypothetical protein